MEKDQSQKIHNTTIAGRGSIITAVEVRSDLWTPFNPPGMLLPERFNFFITVGMFQPRGRRTDPWPSDTSSIRGSLRGGNESVGGEIIGRPRTAKGRARGAW